MGSIYEFEGHCPQIGEGTYIHPEAVLIGSVKIGRGCMICAGAVLRADFAPITIGHGSNVQDNSIIHVGYEEGVVLQDNVLVGHGVILHDVIIKNGSFIGMGAILLPRVIVEEDAVVGAGAVLPPGFIVPARKLVLGNPAKIHKDVSDAMLEENKAGLAFYQELTKKYLNGVRKIEP
ncbi:MAG: gamma carbonic anhydrase family protein [Thermodesulfobacteriota bacterium]|nr:gamma carbonic anhydrase family protein [Thermodesulfobacteriota bacterium]